MCCSHYRSYRSLGKSSNRKHILTKSVRTFRWICPCNKSKPVTAIFDAVNGYLGKVVLKSSLECVFCCKNLSLKIYDHKDRYVYKISFPALNVVSCFGLYPWERHDRHDFKIINIMTQQTAALARKQWSYFCKDRCSNGTHYFLKFK